MSAPLSMARAPSTRASLEEVVSCCERRCLRAAVRYQRAKDEMGEAAVSLAQAKDELAAWALANPDDQLEMF